MRFVKMHGAGNDYVYVDCFSQQVADPAGLARRISDRHFGVGAAGRLLILPCEQADVGMRIEGAAVPVRPAVAGACEALGLDVLNVANEGKFVVIAPADEAGAALAAMRAHPLGRDAAVIGEVLPAPGRGARVTLRTRIGGERVLEMPYGEDLPRIC